MTKLGRLPCPLICTVCGWARERMALLLSRPRYLPQVSAGRFPLGAQRSRRGCLVAAPRPAGNTYWGRGVGGLKGNAPAAPGSIAAK